MAYSTGCPGCNVSTGHKHIGVARAESFRGPFVDLTPGEPVFPFASEDPAIYLDRRTGTWHVLAHTDFTGTAEQPSVWSLVSAHAFARQPEGPWHVSPVPPYNRTITWETGEVSQLLTRERPQIIVNAQGKPILLTNGIEPGNFTSPFHEGGYTGTCSNMSHKYMLILPLTFLFLFYLFQVTGPTRKSSDSTREETKKLEPPRKRKIST